MLYKGRALHDSASSVQLSPAQSIQQYSQASLVHRADKGYLLIKSDHFELKRQQILPLNMKMLLQVTISATLLMCAVHSAPLEDINIKEESPEVHYSPLPPQTISTTTEESQHGENTVDAQQPDIDSITPLTNPPEVIQRHNNSCSAEKENVMVSFPGCKPRRISYKTCRGHSTSITYYQLGLDDYVRRVEKTTQCVAKDEPQVRSKTVKFTCNGERVQRTVYYHHPKGCEAVEKINQFQESPQNSQGQVHF